MDVWGSVMSSTTIPVINQACERVSDPERQYTPGNLEIEAYQHTIRRAGLEHT
jgi:hypothetical protein